MEVTRPIPITRMMVMEAYKRVKANRGSAGVDGESLEIFEANLKDNLYKIWNRLTSGSYLPPAVKAVPIPKAGGKVRVLGVPTVADRVAQMVVKQILEPRLEAVFHASSFGYRPRKGAKDALEQVRRNCWKFGWVIDLDIRAFFDELDHELLFKALERHVSEKWVMLYVGRWLKAEIEEADGTRTARDKGTPQGGVISPLLANLFLHYAFDKWMEQECPELPFERYADDIIVHCNTLEQAEQTLALIRARMEACRLALHPGKTRIVHCKQRNREEDYPVVSFDFLGYTFKPQKVKTKDGRTSLGFGPSVSKGAMSRMNAKIKEIGIHRRTGSTLQSLADRINPMLRGWLNYFTLYRKHDVRLILYNLENRLLGWARNRHKRLHGSFKRAADWLTRRYVENPRLFAHWTAGFTPTHVSQRLRKGRAV